MEGTAPGRADRSAGDSPPERPASSVPSSPGAACLACVLPGRGAGCLVLGLVAGLLASGEQNDGDVAGYGEHDNHDDDGLQGDAALVSAGRSGCGFGLCLLGWRRGVGCGVCSQVVCVVKASPLFPSWETRSRHIGHRLVRVLCPLDVLADPIMDALRAGIQRQHDPSRLAGRIPNGVQHHRLAGSPRSQQKRREPLVARPGVQSRDHRGHQPVTTYEKMRFLAGSGRGFGLRRLDGSVYNAGRRRTVGSGRFRPGVCFGPRRRAEESPMPSGTDRVRAQPAAASAGGPSASSPGPGGGRR